VQMTIGSAVVYNTAHDYFMQCKGYVEHTTCGLRVWQTSQSIGVICAGSRVVDGTCVPIDGLGTRFFEWAGFEPLK
jgi:hypothetical protein